MYVPDAPWIREAERRGTDYMYEFVFGKQTEDDDEYWEREYENE